MITKRGYWFWSFAGIAAVLFFAMQVLSLDAGNSGDEDTFQIPQGNYVLDFYQTQGRDTTCLNFANLKYYGASFDVVISFVNRVFNVDNIHVTRHLFNAFFGWLAILFVGLTAGRIGGWRAGVMAMVILFLSPRFLGHAYNNPKDTPFAAAIMMGCYFLLRFFRQFPDVKKKTLVFLTLSIALAISVRIGGLILFGYFGMFGIAYLIDRYLSTDRMSLPVIISKRRILTRYVRMLLYAGSISIAGYFLGLILWPYALQSPFFHPLQAFKEMSSFAISMRQLFEGHFTMSDTFPWYYTFKYILITTPVAVAMGVIIYPVVGGLKRANRFSTFVVYFAFVFPVFWIAYTNANVYGGWRHAMFVYPPMVVAAGLGFNALVEWAKNKYLKIAFTALPFALLAMPAAHIIRNHPYEYVYFNPFAGGIDKVYGNYEMDYYFHSTRAAAEWVQAHAQRSGLETGDKIVIGSWHPSSVSYFLRHDTARFQTVFIRWRDRNSMDWDYAIFPITGIHPRTIKSPHFPPLNTVHTIDVDHKPICLILRRTDKAAYRAERLREKAGDSSDEQRRTLFDEAMSGFKQALEADPYDEFTLYTLAEMYRINNTLDSAAFCMQKLLEYYPNESNLNLACIMYNRFAQQTRNQEYLNQMLALRKRMVVEFPRDPLHYYNLALLYAQGGDPAAGQKLMDECMDRNGYAFKAFYYMAFYLASVGDREGAIAILEKCLIKFPVHAPAIREVLTPMNSSGK